MITLTIPWSDGTSDVISVSYSGEMGSSQMTVGTPANQTVNDRQKVVNLSSQAGVVLATLTIKQAQRSRSYSADYSISYQ